jgi:hypothetical protein
MIVGQEIEQLLDLSAGKAADIIAVAPSASQARRSSR